MKNESILGKTLIQSAVGLLVFGLILSFLWLIIYLLKRFAGILFLIKNSDLQLVLSILATIGTAMYIYNSNKIEKEKEDTRKQIDLLRILSEELDFLEGNLKAYEKSFSGEGYPVYELWKIDTSIYFANLSHNLNGKETINLKKNLMKIKDKIIIINNFKSEARKIQEERGNEKMIEKLKPWEMIKENIIKRINEEIIPVIKESENMIKNIISD